MEYTIVIPGKAIGKARARKGKDGHWYTPGKTSGHEEWVRASLLVSGDHPMLTGPVEIRMVYYMAIPKSWSKKKQAEALAGRIYPTTKPDASNLQKCVEDALNQVAWKDDVQIVVWSGRKVYSDTPRTAITIRSLGD